MNGGGGALYEGQRLAAGQSLPELESPNHKTNQGPNRCDLNEACCVSSALRLWLPGAAAPYGVSLPCGGSWPVAHN